jgi:3-phenylpropionate/trans-cinnamate dioxygenase ferredoxin subunit
MHSTSTLSLPWREKLNSPVECPLHQGRFDIPSGKAKSAPVCVHLKTYPVRVEDGEVLLGLPVQDAS